MALSFASRTGAQLPPPLVGDRAVIRPVDTGEFDDAATVDPAASSAEVVVGGSRPTGDHGLIDTGEPAATGNVAEMAWILWAIEHPTEANTAEDWLQSQLAPTSPADRYDREAQHWLDRQLAPDPLEVFDRQFGEASAASATTTPIDGSVPDEWGTVAGAGKDDASALGVGLSEDPPWADGGPSEAPVDVEPELVDDAEPDVRASRLVRWTGGLATGIAAILLLFALFLGYGRLDNRWYHLVAVEGGSMEPTYSVGDILILTRPPAELEVGMVVTMQVEGQVVTHRIIEVSEDGSFVTQGDANEHPDEFDGLDVRVVGVVRGHVPWIGNVIGAARSSAWMTDRATASVSAIADVPPPAPLTAVEEADATTSATEQPGSDGEDGTEVHSGDPDAVDPGAGGDGTEDEAVANTGGENESSGSSGDDSASGADGNVGEEPVTEDPATSVSSTPVDEPSGSVPATDDPTDAEPDVEDNGGADPVPATTVDTATSSVQP